MVVEGLESLLRNPSKGVLFMPSDLYDHAVVGGHRWPLPLFENVRESPWHLLTS